MIEFLIALALFVVIVAVVHLLTGYAEDYMGRDE